MAATFALASSEYLTLSNILVTDYPFTMACWFKHTSVVGDGALMSMAVGSASDIRMELRTINTGPVMISRYNVGDNEDTATVATVLADVWHHAAAVFTSNVSGTIYLDGANAVTGTVPVSYNLSADQRTRIANSAGSGSGLFNGSIAVPTLWNVALTAGEVLALAKGFDPRLIRPAAIESLYRLRRTDLVGTSQRDDWRDGNTMTEVNTPTYVDDPPLRYAA